jgi:hypothetical protein
MKVDECQASGNLPFMAVGSPNIVDSTFDSWMGLMVRSQGQSKRTEVNRALMLELRGLSDAYILTARM